MVRGLLVLLKGGVQMSSHGCESRRRGLVSNEGWVVTKTEGLNLLSVLIY